MCGGASEFGVGEGEESQLSAALPGESFSAMR